MSSKSGLYARAPKDLNEIQAKLFFGLTVRQIVCFAIAAALGIPAFFLTRGIIGDTGAIMVMLVIAIPSVAVAIYKYHGQPLEKLALHWFTWRVKRPQTRPYKTENIYAYIQKEIHDKEVLALDSKGSKKAGKGSGQGSKGRGSRTKASRQSKKPGSIRNRKAG